MLSVHISRLTSPSVVLGGDPLTIDCDFDYQVFLYLFLPVFVFMYHLYQYWAGATPSPVTIDCDFIPICVSVSMCKNLFDSTDANLTKKLTAMMLICLGKRHRANYRQGRIPLSRWSNLFPVSSRYWSMVQWPSQLSCETQQSRGTEYSHSFHKKKAILPTYIAHWSIQRE